MSLVPALEESEASSSHGWSASSRFSVDSSGTQSNMLQQLINQNHKGNASNTVVNEEVVYNEGHVNITQEQGSMINTQIQPTQCQYVNNQTPNRPSQTQQHGQVQQRAPQQSPLQKQQQQQSQQMHQNHQKMLQQKQMQQNQATVGKSVPGGKSQPGMVIHTNKTVSQHFQGSTSQISQTVLQKQQLIQQQQQRISHQKTVQGKVGQPVHNMNNTTKPVLSEEARINQQLLLQEKQIAENNRQLEAYGMSPVTLTGSDTSSSQTIASNGGVKQQLGNSECRSPAVLKQSETSDNMRQLLLLSNSQPTSKKVDVKIDESNGSRLTNVSQTLGQSNVQQVQGTPGQRQQKVLAPGQGQGFQTMPKMVHTTMAGGQQQMGSPSVVNQNPVQVSSVSSNQQQGKAGALGMPSINKNNVVLEGGGQFEEGQAYVIRDKHGNSRTMIWSRGEFKPYTTQPENAIIQNSTIDSSQRGRGSRGRRGGPGRGRGRGHQPRNAGNVAMSPRVRGVQNIQPSQQFVRSPMPGGPRMPLPHGQGPNTIVVQVASPSSQQVHTLQLAPNQLQQKELLKNTLQNLMPPAQGSTPKAASDSTRSTLSQEAEGTTAEAGTEMVPGKPAGVEDNTDKPNIPTDPKTVAVCQFCGYTGDDKLNCESCKRKFTSATKYIKVSSVEASDLKRRKLSSVQGNERPNIIDKKAFFGKGLTEQNQLYTQVISAANNNIRMTLPHNSRLVKNVTVRKVRGRGRGRGGMFVPDTVDTLIIAETVTISSDEEDGGTSAVNHSKMYKMISTVTPATAQVVSKSPSHSEQSDCPESPLIPSIPISSRVDGKSRVAKMEDEKGSSHPTRERSLSPVTNNKEITLQARVVRVGTFIGAPVEPILMSKGGINFFIEGRNNSHRFHIYPQEIQQCLARFDDVKTCYVFLLTSQSCGIRTRHDLGMPSRTSIAQPIPEPYFDPHSADLTHQMITIFIDRVDLATRTEFQKHMDSYKSYGKQADEGFFMELNEEETGEILKQSMKKTTPHRVVPMMHPSAMITPDHPYSHQMEEDRQSASPSPPRIGFAGPIIRLLTYPPPPAKGGISITNEDLYCLQEGEFLNDVIIDFYLKYLFLEKFSEEDRARTHIFSSFFYKRLTQRIRGASLDDDPSVPMPVKRHARVKTWTRHVDLFKKDFIVIPINEHAHWFLAIICFPGMEEPQENVYIPKALTAPLVDPSSCPTPPQPTDVNTEEDMETEEQPENPVPEKKEQETSPESAEVPMDSSEKTESDKAAADAETTTDKEGDTQTDSQPADASTSTEAAEDEEPKTTSVSEAGVGTTEEADTQTNTKVEGAIRAPAFCKVIRGRPLKENEERPEEALSGIKQPSILIFDSLSGPSRSRIVQVLKEYLQVEWQVKKGGTELNKSVFRGCVAKVPQQNNFSDCGVFMLQYVESFFEDPIQDFTTPVRGLHDWFTGPLIDGKREELRDLIIGLKEKYESQEEAKDNS